MARAFASWSAVTLRVQDIDFGANQIVIRSGRGTRIGVTMLPALAKTDLARHLETARAQHQDDLAVGAGWVELPTALVRKYPHAGREWAWQWVFPATRIYRDRRTGQRRRHHLHESVLQRAVRTRSAKRASPSAAVPTRCDTRLRHTCWRMATTSAPSKSFLGTAM